MHARQSKTRQVKLLERREAKIIKENEKHIREKQSWKVMRRELRSEKKIIKRRVEKTREDGAFNHACL